jgi:hypothetical protein
VTNFQRDDIFFVFFLFALCRELAFMETARNTRPFPDPGGMLVGPKVCLIKTKQVDHE